jgi:hypothetical protein
MSVIRYPLSVKVLTVNGYLSVPTLFVFGALTLKTAMSLSLQCHAAPTAASCHRTPKRHHAAALHSGGLRRSRFRHSGREKMKLSAPEPLDGGGFSGGDYVIDGYEWSLTSTDGVRDRFKICPLSSSSLLKLRTAIEAGSSRPRLPDTRISIDIYYFVIGSYLFNNDLNIEGLRCCSSPIGFIV